MASPKLSEIVEEGYEHLQGLCPKCSMWRTMSLHRLTVTPGKIDFAKLTLAQLIERLRCHKCGSPMQDVSPWRHSDSSKDTKPKGAAKKRA